MQEVIDNLQKDTNSIKFQINNNNKVKQENIKRTKNKLKKKYKMKKFFNAHEKNDAGILTVFVALFILFYINNQVLNVVAVIIALMISILFNFHVICVLVKRLEKRIY